MSQTGAREAEFFGFTEAGAVEELLERARVVGVLDAWAAARPLELRRVELRGDGPGLECLWTTTCTYTRSGDSPDERYTVYQLHGPTPDAARAAAAKAIENGEV